MPRLSPDDLKHCINTGRCLDCYQKHEDTLANKRQKRGRLEVPCCYKHFYAHKNKISEADARKYARTSARKRLVRQCVVKGCKNKLIPQELLPPSIKEGTCGLHGSFKAFQKNRDSMLRLITEHCLEPEERKGMTAQDVVYRRGSKWVLFGSLKGRAYTTIVFSASSLLELHQKIR